MVPKISEINFPEYATMSQATCSLQDMAEKTITTQIKIDGEITPDFSYDWEVEFDGEKYIMPLRKPQAAKENTSLNSTIDLTFQHWAIYQLKRWMFFTIQPIESGTAVPDKYIASVSLNLKDFCALFGQVLQYYYGDKITIDLNEDWQYSIEPTNIEISHSYIWDVLIQFYELYAVRWQIEPTTENNNFTADGEKYVIKVGYPTTELSHIFSYGFEGGLLKIERQVQDDDIRNMLLGRGGSQNLPYRYFKNVDPDNKSFPADPDWIPELANIYFSELHGATFRSYIQGWKAKHYNGATTKAQSYAPWAWELGYTDEKFNPVEFVKDDKSITKYGELLGGLENNEDIYPSIQGVSIDGLGRIDEIVDIEQILSDDIETTSDNEAKPSDLGDLKIKDTVYDIAKDGTGSFSIKSTTFYVDQGKVAVFDIGAITLKAWEGHKFLYFRKDGKFRPELGVIYTNISDSYLEIASLVYRIYNASTDDEISAVNLSEGMYYCVLTATVVNNYSKSVAITLAAEAPTLIDRDEAETQWVNTFDIWIKNIWGSTKLSTETEEEYKERIWRPILGDREGNEAKVVFSSGMLSTSEDYEFTIINDGVHYDTSKSIPIKDINGNDTDESYPSEWRLTLAKSDADLESTGLYLPSTKRQGAAGDRFFFIGIDLPHQYVLWNEQRLDDYKQDELAKVCDIMPTWVISLDKVRIANKQDGETKTLLEQLKTGSSIRLADKRFILNEEDEQAAYETLYIESITYTFNEPSSDSTALIPDVEIVLSDKYETTASPVATLQGSVDAIQKQLGSISNIEQIVRAVGDKLYLRKDGILDRSMSPTEFNSLVSSTNFRKGIIGGTGWGCYKDEDNNWVLETDRLNIRQNMQVNDLVINQISVMGGKEISSAASLTISRVEQIGTAYNCYFDQKDGSVKNLFKRGDIALCERYDASLNQTKYYKRRVTSVTPNCVRLSVTIQNGGGIPEEGDIICHYGSYEQAARRYVKVRDVIGGGYERYIEGLRTVNTDGTEYYFVGRIDGDTPRFFIGKKNTDENGNEVSGNQYIEYKDGVLTIKGKLSIESTIGDDDATLLDFFDDKYGYLARALKQSTVVDGGLVQTTAIRLGETNENNEFVEHSGTSGIFDSDKPGNGLAFWAGGGMVDPEDESTSVDHSNDPAFGVRMDGSAFAARNTIRFKDRVIEVGDNIELRSSGLFGRSGDDVVLSIVNESVGSVETALSGATEYFYMPTNLPTVRIELETKDNPLVGEDKWRWLSYFQPIKINIPSSPIGSRLELSSYTISFDMNPTAGGTIPATGIKMVTRASMGIYDSNGTLQETLHYGYFTETSTNHFTLSFPSISTTYKYSGQYIQIISEPIYGSNRFWEDAALFSANFKGIVYKQLANQIKLGNDGILSTWGTSALLMNKDVIFLNVGSMCLRITGQAVEIGRDGGTGSFTPLIQANN